MNKKVVEFVGFLKKKKKAEMFWYFLKMTFVIWECIGFCPNSFRDQDNCFIIIRILGQRYSNILFGTTNKVFDCLCSNSNSRLHNSFISTLFCYTKHRQSIVNAVAELENFFQGAKLENDLKNMFHNKFTLIQQNCAQCSVVVKTESQI